MSANVNTPSPSLLPPGEHVTLPKTRATNRWALPVVLLVVIWLSLVFSTGGYLQRQWLLPGIALAALALALFAFGAYPRVPSRSSLAVLGLMLAYTLWVALSAAWAPSSNNVWDEAGRTAVYLLVLALALTFLADARTRAWLRYALAGAVLVLVAMAVWRLATAPDLQVLFSEDRFTYPVSYANNTAALYLIPFWPLLWAAADPKERWFVRGPALGLCTALLMLALLTQSRGAFWAFALTVVLTFLLSPARLRTLVHFAVPLGITAAAFSTLNQYWRLGPDVVGNGPAVRCLLAGVATGAAVGVVLALADRRLKLKARLRMILGVAALVAVLGLSTAGLLIFDRAVGPPLAWATSQWHNLTTDTPAEHTSDASVRFLALSTSGRWDLWRVGWRDFLAHPVTGVGAGNYPFSYDRFRTTERDTRTVHSLYLQTLGETGIVGTVLFFAALLLALGCALAPRLTNAWHRLLRLTRRRPPDEESADPPPPDYAAAWSMALVVAVGYWLIHGAVDWLWYMPAVTIPALLFLALAVAEVETRVPGGLGTATTPGYVTPRESPLGSAVFRWTAAAVSLLILAGLLMPYISLRYQDMAAGNLRTDVALAAAQTRVAARFAPTSPGPLTLESQAYRQAAATAVSPGARLDNLALALWAADRACTRDPAGWVVHYQAAQAAMELAAEADLSSAETLAAPGTALGSLATSPETRAAATHYRSLSATQLRDMAASYAKASRERNPLEPIEIDLLVDAQDTAPAGR